MDHTALPHPPKIQKRATTGGRASLLAIMIETGGISDGHQTPLSANFDISDYCGGRCSPCWFCSRCTGPGHRFRLFQRQGQADRFIGGRLLLVHGGGACRSATSRTSSPIPCTAENRLKALAAWSRANLCSTGLWGISLDRFLPCVHQPVTWTMAFRA